MFLKLKLLSRAQTRKCNHPLFLYRAAFPTITVIVTIVMTKVTGKIPATSAIPQTGSPVPENNYDTVNNSTM